MKLLFRTFFQDSFYLIMLFTTFQKVALNTITTTLQRFIDIL